MMRVLLRGLEKVHGARTLHEVTPAARKLLVGMHDLNSMSRVHPAGPAWSHMVETIVSAGGVDPRRRLQAQRILIVNKGGAKGGGQVNKGVNRIIENAAEVAGCLRTTFGVEVDVWSYNGESMAQQLQLASNYSVCITVSGGTAITCQFVPRDASAIYIGAWISMERDGTNGVNHNMEHVNWTWDWRHKTFAYPLMEGETRPSSSPSADQDHPGFHYMLKWKHGDGFVVSLPRMALVVASALSDAEQAFGLANSFKPLPADPARRDACAAGDPNAPKAIAPRP